MAERLTEEESSHEADAAGQVKTRPPPTRQDGTPEQSRARTVVTGSDDAPEGLWKGRKPLHKRLLLPVVVMVLLILGVFYGVPYYEYAVSHEWTDSAFIDGHIIAISPNVSGQVLKVHVTDNQEVAKGDLLVEIDPGDYRARLRQAEAMLQAAIARHEAAQSNVELTQLTADAGVQQALAGLDLAQAALQTAHRQVAVARTRIGQAQAQVETALANVAQAQAQVIAAEAEATRAGADVRRLQELAQRDQVSRQELDHAVAAARTATAQLEAARKRVAAAEAQVSEARAAQQMSAESLRQSESHVGEAEARIAEARGRLAAAQARPHEVGVSRAQAQSAHADVEQARASVVQAELALSYAQIHAPESGRVTRKVVEEGAYIQVGQTLMAIVPAHVWVVANFKETQLRYMRPGQPAQITVDAYPGKILMGYVDSMQSGTGARFSLLPPENATGNFVKVVQRVPVKIALDEPPDPNYLLAPGMSVMPVVKIK